jgi:cobalt-zinc-cadmium efflux system outer membrane protein
MKRQMTLIGAVLLLVPTRSFAQVAPVIDPAQGVTVNQLVERALDRAPQILAARSEIDVARGDLVQARLRPNPTVSSSRQEQLRGTDNQTMFEIEWPLDVFRRSGRLTVAERAVEATTLSVEDRERLHAAAVREQAGRVLTAARTLAVTDDLLALNRRTRDLLQARVKEGASPPLDLNLAEVEVRRIEAQRPRQVAAERMHLLELKALVGLPPDAPLALRDDLEAAVRAESAAPPAGTNRDDALGRRADVREASARARLASARAQQMRREGRFDLSLYGNYSRMDFSFPQRAFDPAGSIVPIRGLFHNVSVGAMVMVPFSDRKQGAIAAADAEHRRAEQAAAARELAARAEIAAAIVRDTEARKAVELYAAGARELARRNLEVVREAYELGRSALFDVFAEQRRYLELESAYTDALSEAYQARTALRRALGEVR